MPRKGTPLLTLLPPGADDLAPACQACLPQFCSLMLNT